MRSRPILVLLLASPLLGCMEGAKPTPLARQAPASAPAPTAVAVKEGIPTLFKQLGGTFGVKLIVKQFVTSVQTDDQVPDRLKQPLQGDAATDVLVKLFGPTPPEGGLKAIFPDADLTQAEFDALAADLQAVLAPTVPEASRPAVMARFRELGKDVIKPAP